MSCCLKKTLGVLLNWKEDVFLFILNIQPGSKTYRLLLSNVCALYDPLGFSWTPITLPARILLQDVCRTKPEWDEILPQPLLDRWDSCVSNLSHLESATISRCLQPSTPVFIQLHTFVDASESGYGAVSYLRVCNGNKFPPRSWCLNVVSLPCNTSRNLVWNY